MIKRKANSDFNEKSQKKTLLGFDVFDQNERIFVKLKVRHSILHEQVTPSKWLNSRIYHSGRKFQMQIEL